MKTFCSLSPADASRKEQWLNTARFDVAKSLVGRAVSLMVDARKTRRGIVAGVLSEAGLPKLVVNGLCYDPAQVLSSSPASLHV